MAHNMSSVIASVSRRRRDDFDFGVRMRFCLAGSLFFGTVCFAGESVPAVLKGGFQSFSTPLPKSSGQWENTRPVLREKLLGLLGEMPELFVPEPEITEKRDCDGYTLEKFSFDNGMGDTVYGYCLLPDGEEGKRPAILYNHWHAGQYGLGKDEVLEVTHEQLGFATGEKLARKGYVVLCIDAYAFGQRRFQGPAGEREEGGRTESSLFKTFLWQGKTLWGMIVRDDMLALNYLASRLEVDPERIAAMGVSMGSTRTWWLAALDKRIKAAVSVACLTRYQNLIAEGEVRCHGIYYFVPDVLREGIDTESIVALIAPRAHLTLTGTKDAGSPAAGVRIINDYQRKLYDILGAPDSFRGVLYPDVAHAYTPAMWEETVTWLEKHL